MRVLSKSLLVAFLLLSAGLAVQDIATPNVANQSSQGNTQQDATVVGFGLACVGASCYAGYRFLQNKTNNTMQQANWYETPPQPSFWDNIWNGFAGFVGSLGKTAGGFFTWLLGGTIYIFEKGITLPLKKYVLFPNRITPDDPQISSLARKLSTGNYRQDIKNIVEFIRQNIPYKKDEGLLFIPIDGGIFGVSLGADYWKLPSETLAHGAGDCEDRSFLFASLVKALGYPVRVVAGQLDGGGHAWPEININGVWVPVEPITYPNAVDYIFNNPEEFREEAYVDGLFGEYNVYDVIGGW